MLEICGNAGIYSGSYCGIVITFMAGLSRVS